MNRNSWMSGRVSLAYGLFPLSGDAGRAHTTAGIFFRAPKCPVWPDRKRARKTQMPMSAVQRALKRSSAKAGELR
jgi:hypothetical protein